MYKSNDYRPFGTMYVDDAEWENLKALNKPLDDTIVECYRDEQERWRFLRFRDDKVDANHISTVDSVLESIEDRVSEEDLIRAAPAIKTAWKRRQAQAAEEEAARQRSAEEERRRRANGNSNTNGIGVGMKRKHED
jgi:mRNA guanylyltransferase